MPILGVIASSIAKGIPPISLNGAGYLFNPYKDGGGSFTSTRIEKFDFVTEGRTTISATMPDTRGAGGGFGNGTTAGYVAGGLVSPTVFDTTQKLTYSGETRSQISSTFDTARFNAKGFGNTAGTNGYIAGGQNLAGTYYATMRKLAFSTETWSSPSSVLTSSRAGPGPAANPSVAGYWMGGYSGSASLANVDKMLFSNEAVSNLGNILPGGTARDNLGCMSNTAVAAYVVGNGGTFIYKFAYASDTFTTLSDTMPYANNFSAYWSCPQHYASVAGARTTYPDTTAAIQKISYITDTRTASGSTLQQAEETSNYGVSNAQLGA